MVGTQDRKTSMANWPHQSECQDFYGQPGRVELVKLIPPYPLFYDEKPISFFYIHHKCRDSAMRVLTAVKNIYGDRIHALGLDRYDGCYNPRKMRGGNAWSMHAYGCAIDFDASHNQFREDHRTARFARPEYKEWMDAWEVEGWVSLGRARDFDWMHFQAARL
jgi:hypothetical protein